MDNTQNKSNTSCVPVGTSHSDNINPEGLYGLGSCCNLNSRGTAGMSVCVPAIEEIISLSPAAQPSLAASSPYNNNPSLAQAQVAYDEGASTSETAPDNVNRYSGTLDNIPFIEGLTKMDASNAGLAPTPAAVQSSGASLDPSVQSSVGMNTPAVSGQMPVTAESLRFHNGFMRTQIGRRVTVDFLVGSNTIVQKTGYLLGVAQDYILLNELDTDDITTCDYYNIKFIRYYY